MIISRTGVIAAVLAGACVGGVHASHANAQAIEMDWLFDDTNHDFEPRRILGPYERVEIVFDSVTPPPELDALLADLRELASRRSVESFEPYLAESFFWLRDFGGAFDPHAPAFANFITALRLDAKRMQPGYLEESWRDFAHLLAATSWGSVEDRSEAICTHAPVQFLDEDRAFATFERFMSDYAIEWFYAEGPVSVRQSPDPYAPVMGVIENEAVLLTEFYHEYMSTDGGYSEYSALTWYGVLLPNGNEGYVEIPDLKSFIGERLCFALDASGDWRIAGYVAAGD